MSETMNVFEVKTHLSRHLERLERGEIDALIVARAGKPVARLALLDHQTVPLRIGHGNGRYVIPEDWDMPDMEIENLFATGNGDV
ncbi:type II toxin-antitoxin system prevent-host-death family antitoxin [Acidithiobacillus sp. MC6.1]|nr:type II toxin-antitoxin system prevent-host-death family antitoxin [Acidithiobacillus sp. MC6.1]